MLKICTLVMKIRWEYGARKSRLLGYLTRWSRMSSRRTRARKIILTLRKRVQHHLAGKLREGDQEDLRRIDRAMMWRHAEMSGVPQRSHHVHGRFGRKSQACVRPAVQALVQGPGHVPARDERTIGGRVDGSHNTDVVELLISRLCQMRISELVLEQTIVRDTL